MSYVKGFFFPTQLIFTLMNSYMKVIKVYFLIEEFTFRKHSNDNRYQEELADKLFNEVRILCWVFTHPDNHKIKVPHIRNTWGKKCNKLLFMSVAEDPEIPELVVLPVENGRGHLWFKTKHAMEYVYKNHINDAEWFMRADDDKLETI